MPIRVTIDPIACNGYGNCVVDAPSIFAIDPETNLAIVLPGHPTDEEVDALEEASADCPVDAITIAVT